jgi:polysaccharide export outer membrane protein
MIKTKKSLAAALWIVPTVNSMFLAGCATTAPDLPTQMAEQANSEYRLGLGDKLRVYVYGEKDLSGQYQVTSTGVITMPLIGDVPAVGLTARELEAKIAQAYGSGYLKHPSIAVEVYDFRPYFVMGEVERPGQFPAKEGMTLLGAIATAGGYTYRANTKHVYIRRAGTNEEYRVDPTRPIMVQPGDVIRVGERYF